MLKMKAFITVRKNLLCTQESLQPIPNHLVDALPDSTRFHKGLLQFGDT